LLLGGAGFELGLADFGVDVAELLPPEIVEVLDHVAELVVFEVLVGGLDDFGEAGQDPLV